jgi:hypothetical protein
MYTENWKKINETKTQYMKIFDRSSPYFKVVDVHEKYKGEYYKHFDGTKVLKTPRSGIQFATPTDKIFIEGTDIRAESPIIQASGTGGGAVKEVPVGNAVANSTSDYLKKISDPNIKKFLDLATRGAVTKQLKFAFVFSISIRYYNYMDRIWGSIPAADAAYIAYLKKNWLKMPRLQSFQSVRQVTFDGRRPTQITKEIIGA